MDATKIIKITNTLIMETINYNKHIWEGWTVQSFIDELNELVTIGVTGESHFKTIQTKKDLKEFCMSNQPYYKKYIPEVVEYFAQKFDLK
jgi:hypothetical protein